MRIGLAVTVLILIALPLTVFFVLNKTGFINKAAAPASSGGVATVSLSPSSGSYAPGEQFEVEIKVNTRGVKVSIIQVHLTYSYEGEKAPIEVVDSLGTKADLTQIKPGSIPELNFITNDVTDNLIPGSKQHQVIVRLDGVIASDTKPYANESDIVFGTISFKALSPTEKLVLHFDPELSKITTFDTGQDILLIPTDATFTITGEAKGETPKISSIYPTRGVVGNTVIIEGENFGEEQGESKVLFGDTQAGKTDVKSWHDKSITLLVPQDAKSGKITVTTAGGSALSTDIFEVSAGETTSPTPHIESFHPQSATPGTSVTIIGTNFGASQETSLLTLGESNFTEITTWSNVLIEAKIPASAVTDSVKITTKDGAATSSTCLEVTGTTSTNPVCLSQDFNTTGISTQEITQNSATIAWATDQASDSKVVYGLTSGYGKESEILNTTTAVTNHSVPLTSLTSCTTYHFQTVSTVNDNRSVSGDTLFTTLGCLGEANVVEEQSRKVTSASGGTVSLTQSGESLSVEAPSGYTSSDTTIQIKKLESNSVIGATTSPTNSVIIGGNVYEIDSRDNTEEKVTSFAQPITITVSYNPLDVANINEATLKLHWWNGTDWEALENCQVNTSAHTVSCTTTHFTTFGLFGEELAQANTPTQPASPTGPQTEATPSTEVGEPTETTPSPTPTQPAQPQPVSEVPVTGVSEYSQLIYFVGIALVIMGLLLPGITMMVNKAKK